MSKELNLGDKVWIHYGQNVLIVGHLVDHTADFSLVAFSPLPYDDYKEMTSSSKASCPVSWCEVKACHYLSHIPYKEIAEMDEKVKSPRLGFGK